MENLEQYIKDGRLSVKTTKKNDQTYSIVCYTKDQFFNHEWDETCIKHRGVIYNAQGKQINTPFDKIFNVDEQPSTSMVRVLDMIKTEQYEVLDKLNGHLVIVSYDQEHDNIFVTTKGSFTGELAEADTVLAYELGIVEAVKNHPDTTFMFECLADYDKHMYFDDQKAAYGVSDNTLILIGAITENHSFGHGVLSMFAQEMGVPVCHRYTDLEKLDDISSLYDHKNCEGYVFHFPQLNFRFKIKTTQYITLRYIKEITPEKLVNKFYTSGLDNMYLDYDEELYDIIDMMRIDYVDFVHNHLLNFDQIKDKYYGYNNADGFLTAKDIHTDDSLNFYQKTYITKGWCFDNSKSARSLFKKHGKYPKLKKLISEVFDKKLAEIA